MKFAALIAIALTVSACGPSIDNDPIYAALKANPPTEVPARFIPELRKEFASLVPCEVFNEGRSNQYMTCWFSSGLPRSGAALTYYPPSVLNPPSPENFPKRGGVPITEFIKF